MKRYSLDPQKGLVEDLEGALVLVTVEDYATLERLRARNRKRQAEWRGRRQGVTVMSRLRNGDITVTDPNTLDFKASQQPEMTLPLPLILDLSNPKIRARQALIRRGSRLPEDWQPGEKEIAYARNLRLSDVPRVAELFRNYWLAKAGKEAVKLDWTKTWQNWCLRESERGGAPQRGGAVALQRDVAAWAEAKELARAVGFREPWPQESAGAYLTSVKFARDTPPTPHALRGLKVLRGFSS